MRSEFNFSELYKGHPLKMHNRGQKETWPIMCSDSYVATYVCGGGVRVYAQR